MLQKGDRVPTYAELASSREILSVFVEADCHDTVGRVEGLFHAVAVVAVDVDVQHPWVSPKKLQNAEDDVIDVAEPRGFPLLCVVQPTRPVDGYVGCARRESPCGLC